MKGHVMNSRGNELVLHHQEAELFISRYKEKYKREARKLQRELGIKYRHALDAAAQKFGFKRYYFFTQQIAALKERAQLFAVDDIRIRCAHHTQPNPETRYYWLRAYLGLDEDGQLMTRSVACCLTTWVGFVDGDTNRELRKGAFVIPHRIIDSLRGTKHSLYVIDDEESLFLWLLVWGGYALIPEEFIKKSEFLVGVTSSREYPPNSI